MTQTLVEGSKLLSKSYTSSSLDRDDGNNSENCSLIKTIDALKVSQEKLTENDKTQNGTLSLPKEQTEHQVSEQLQNGDMLSACEISEKLNIDHANSKHLYPQVLVQTSNELSDLDSDEEDFQLRMHRKNDSGQGSSVETSSLKSNATQEFYQVDIHFNEPNGIRSENEALVFDDKDFPRRDSLSQRHSNYSGRLQQDKDFSKTASGFTDIPLNTPSRSNQINTFIPKLDGTLQPVTFSSSMDSGLRPPSNTLNNPFSQKIIKRTNQNKSWKIFGKVAVPVPAEPPQQPSQSLLRKEKAETVASSTTALIFENRPSFLPPKAAKEEQKHRQQYEEMIAFAKRKELKDQEVEKKKLKQKQKLEDRVLNTVRTWKEDIIPNWSTCKTTKKVRELWWSGVPPSVRGKVWQLAIGNDLYITPELFQIFQANARDKIRNQKTQEPVATLHTSESSLVVSKENTIGLITLDVSRTFPALGIFQKGGPYHDPLKHLLAAYTCFRPDVGYVQGMSFLAAMLLLNMDLVDAFIAFANLLNRPCQMAFFMVDQPMMDAYFRTFGVLLEDQIPRLFKHMKNENLTSDIYLIDWVFTLFSKSLPLDTACRVWDMFCRDGEEFLFRTALGILLMNEQALLEMEFFRLAQYLTKLSTNITSDELFKYIEKINFSKQKLQSTLAHYKAIAKQMPSPPAPT